MRRLLLAALALPLAAGAAHAQTRQDMRAAEERLVAERRFEACPTRPEVARTSCRRTRERIVETFVRARLGEPAKQREFAAMLVTGSGPLRGDREEACMWRQMILLGTTGRRDEAEREVASACGPLSPEDREVARRRAMLLGQEIAMDAELRARRRR